MVLAHGAQTPGSAKSPTRDSLEAQPVEFESLMQESGSADFLARHALYSQPPLCVCVCIVGRRVMFWAPGSRHCHGVPSGLLPPPGADAERWSADGASAGQADPGLARQ